MTAEPVRVDLDAPGGRVSGLWMPAPGAVAAAVIAHGAGAPMTHPFMEGAAAGLVAGGVSVLRFNFPFMEEGRRRPDPPPVLLRTWRAAIDALERRRAGLPMILGGKSLGGRIASMAAARDGAACPASALVFFGYPLHPAGQTDRLRDAHLPDIRVPMLFIQGTRDALARFDLVQALIRRLEPLARLHVVPDADHAFHVRGARRPDGDAGRALGLVAADYVRSIAGEVSARRARSSAAE